MRGRAAVALRVGALAVLLAVGWLALRAAPGHGARPADPRGPGRQRHGSDVADRALADLHRAGRPDPVTRAGGRHARAGGPRRTSVAGRARRRAAAPGASWPAPCLTASTRSIGRRSQRSTVTSPGAPTPSGSASPTSAPWRPSASTCSTSRWLTGTAAAGRWSLWTGLVLLFGAACVCLIVWRGSLPAGGGALLGLGWLLAAVGVSTVIVTERAIVRAPSLLPLFETHEGMVLLGQGAAVLVACGLAVYAVNALPRSATLVGLAAAAAVAMLSVVWGSHANGVSVYRPVDLTLQWLHVIAVGAWVGGLAWLLLGLRGLPGPTGPPPPAASRPSPHRLGRGPAHRPRAGRGRGRHPGGSSAHELRTLLLVKLALFCVLVALGARNHFVQVPPRRATTLRLPFDARYAARWSWGWASSP